MEPNEHPRGFLLYTPKMQDSWWPALSRCIYQRLKGWSSAKEE